MIRMICYSIAHKKQGDKTYEFNEILNDNRKQSYVIYSQSLEDLDNLTSCSSSPQDLCELEKEIIIKSARTNEDEPRKMPTFSEPFILIEASAGEKLSTNFITDIVYYKDKKMLDNRYSIRLWAEEYLREHPEHIYDFDNLRGMYFKNYPGQKITSDLAVKILNACLKTENYRVYREVYFKLKVLDKEKAKKLWNI